jgi:Putative auto-transporter adhesin, head GIN domain
MDGDNMHRIRLAVGAPLLLALIAGCNTWHTSTAGPTPYVAGSGQFVTESRPVQAISHVIATAGLRVTIAHTGAPSLDITAEDNIIPLIESVERGGVLTLGWKPSIGSVSAQGVEIRVGVRELRGVEASGAAQIDVDGIRTGDFTVALSGASQFSASGVVERLLLDASGASRVRAAALACGSVSARLSGASHVLVRIGRSLVATLSGASLLEFHGDPSVEATVSDTSVVRRVGP